MKNILYGGDLGSDVEICLKSQSLGEALLNSLNSSRERTVLIDGITGEMVSGNELKLKAIRLAKYLQHHFGVKRGDVISICSENRIEFGYAIHATLFLGTTVAPINHSYIKDEISHALNLSKPKIIFVSPNYLEKIVDTAKKHSFVEQIILFDKDNTMKRSKIISFTKIIGSSVDTKEMNDFKCQPQDMKDNNVIKIVKKPMHKDQSPTGERVVLIQLPMFHAYGVCLYTTGTLNPLWTYVLLPRFVEEDFLRCIETYKVSNIYVVPPILLFLAKSPLVKKYDLSSLCSIIYGAAPAGPDMIDAAIKNTGLNKFRQGYGMTEGTYAFITQDDNHDVSKNGSTGVLLKGIYGRVVDLDSGECLGPGKTGELHFKGPNIMKGYIGNLQATSAMIDANGWLHTGDVGYYDENGEWYIVDRIKELIKYKGFQTPPAEIEALLIAHPKIKDAGVIGIPDEVCGEKAFAFIVKQPGAPLIEKEVIDYVAARLSKPKHLHGGVRFIDVIPKSLSGKILRRVLRDMVNNHKAKL